MLDLAALVLCGSPLGAALAAVVLYRIFQVGVPALLGAAPPAASQRRPCATVS